MRESPKLLVDRLAAAAARRRFGDDTTAYRLCNAEGDGLAGVAVDWFDGVAVLSLYRQLLPEEEWRIADALVQAAKVRSVYLKRRPKEARFAAAQVDKLAPERPFVGDRVDELVVRENGLSFLIRPPNGLSVGLYLDARELRKWVREHAYGKSVLNTFAYTCGFGIAALAGGAWRVVNVDVSRRVLDWGADNARLNGLGPMENLVGDAFDWLRRLANKRQAFDLVILDPPSFATTKRSRFSAAADYGRLAQAASVLVAPGGALVCACNMASLSRRRFEAMVTAAVGGVVSERLGPSPMDFPAVGEPALKIAVVRL